MLTDKQILDWIAKRGLIERFWVCGNEIDFFEISLQVAEQHDRGLPSPEDMQIAFRVFIEKCIDLENSCQ